MALTTQCSCSFSGHISYFSLVLNQVISNLWVLTHLFIPPTNYFIKMKATSSKFLAPPITVGTAVQIVYTLQRLNTLPTRDNCLILSARNCRHETKIIITRSHLNVTPPARYHLLGPYPWEVPHLHRVDFLLLHFPLSTPHTHQLRSHNEANKLVCQVVPIIDLWLHCFYSRMLLPEFGP